MTDRKKRGAWALALVLLGAYLVVDVAADPTPAPLGGEQHVSFQVDVTDISGQGVYDVPANRVFILKDIMVRNTWGSSKFPEAASPVHPSLSDGAGALKVAGTNLMDWPMGGAQSEFGGGSQLFTQTGLILTGGVVFEPGTTVTVHDYEGPLYFDGVLRRP